MSRRLRIVFMLLALLFMSLPANLLAVNREADSSAYRNGLPNRAMVLNYGLVINVSDYNGSTDSERIQSALNDVPPGGAEVFIPSGTWYASNLSGLSNTLIMGDNGTVLVRPDNTTSPFITFENETGFAVVNVVFDGQNILGGEGILVSDGTDFQVANDTFQNVDTNAVNIVGYSENFVVENNVLVNSNNAPIRVWGTPGSRIIGGFLIANNTLMDSQANGKIGVAFAENGTISDNYIENCTYGIATRDDSDLSITRNTIENVSSYGIYLGTQIEATDSYGVSSNIVISSNYITNSNVGIARYYGTGLIVNVSVSDNTIICSNQSDIYADFPASFVNNTLDSRSDVTLLTIPMGFVGNVDVNGTAVIPSDINGDGIVDMRDVGLVARFYGTTRASLNWNPALDVIKDGVIDLRDLGYVARCFMQTS